MNILHRLAADLAQKPGLIGDKILGSRMRETFRRRHGYEGLLDGRYEARKRPEGWQLVFRADPGPGMPTGNRIIIGAALDAATTLRMMLEPESRHLQHLRLIDDIETDLPAFLDKLGKHDKIYGGQEHIIDALAKMRQQKHLAAEALSQSRSNPDQSKIIHPNFGRKL